MKTLQEVMNEAVGMLSEAERSKIKGCPTVKNVIDGIEETIYQLKLERTKLKIADSSEERNKL